MLAVTLVMSTAFMPSVKPNVKNFNYVGDIKPTGFFDPLGISTEKNSKYLREFELQHGRVAMVASVLIPLFEMMKPGTLGINYLSDMDFNSQLPFWYVMGLVEFYRMKTGWDNPFAKNGSAFTLKDDFQPGNYLNVNKEKVSDRRYNAELSNGRLAMLAAAHMVASEVVTGNPLF